jgi:hypothetical protein
MFFLPTLLDDRRIRIRTVPLTNGSGSDTLILRRLAVKCFLKHSIMN